MIAADRHKKIAEVEEVIAKLQKLGWRVEEVQHTDQPDADFTTKITLSYRNDDERAGIL